MGDVVDWRPSKASRFDIVVTETPEDRQIEDYLAIPRGQEEDIESSETEDYEFVPRNVHGPGGDHAVRKNRYLSPEKFDVTIVDRPEDRQTEDYLAIPREDEEDEENSETEDYLAIPRGQEEDIESSEIEDYEFVPRNDHGPGGDHLSEKLDTSVDKWKSKINEKKQKIAKTKLYINNRRNKKEHFKELPLSLK